MVSLFQVSTPLKNAFVDVPVEECKKIVRVATKKKTELPN
jgi:hypothetical protein